MLVSITGFSQITDTWDAVKVGSTDIGKIYVGSNLVWEKTTTSTTVLYLETTSTSSTWSPQMVIKTGATLVWTVTGAVTTTATINDPVFDFSTAGTKYITVTSSDGASGLTRFECYGNTLTVLDVSGATSLIRLFCYSNSLTLLNVSGATLIEEISCHNNSLTSLNVSNNTALTDLWCYSNNLTVLDVSNNTALTNFRCQSNLFSSSTVDGIICDVEDFNTSNGDLDISNNATPTSTGEACITTLESRGWTVVSD